MSLLSVMARPEVSSALARAVRPPFVQSLSVIAKELGGDRRLVGTAFDYALRFGLASREWACHSYHAAEATMEMLAQRPALLTDENRLHGLHERYGAALEALGSLNTPMMDEEQAAAALFLARLENVYRGGDLDALLGMSGLPEQEDLAALYSLIPWKEIRPGKRAILNPTFGMGSHAVGGADGDVLVDDLLVEIKVTILPEVPFSAVLQVVAYALLARGFGVDGAGPQETVNRIGIYHARSGVLLSTDLRNVVSEMDETDLLELLVREGGVLTDWRRHEPE